MVNSELNKRLLKRASYYNRFIEGSPSNEAIGSLIFDHAQALGTLEPSDPRFQQYLESSGLDYETGIKSHELGQLLLQAVRDPAIADAILSGDTESLKNTEVGQRIENLISQGFTTPGFEQGQGAIGSTAESMGIPYGKVINPDRIDPTAIIAGRTLSGADYFDAQGNLKQPDTSWSTKFAPLAIDGANSDQIAKMRIFRNNPHLQEKVKQQFAGQIIKGMGQSFNRNSPLVRAGVSHLGTRYIQNKIDEWAPKDSAIGGAFNSFGNWLLKLFSMMPGYESIMNWLADWKYGDKFKALPGQIQSYGAKAMYPQVPYPAPNTNNTTAARLPSGQQQNTAPQTPATPPAVMAARGNFKPQAPTVPAVNNSYKPNTAIA